MEATRVEMELGGRTLSFETGKIAKQATGAVMVQLGETVVLVASVEGSPIPGRDFFPLTVDYREKTYAAGKFPGGYIKREGRPSTKETLTSRLIDRPIRPLFPPGYVNELVISATVLSVDKEVDPDILAMIGASASLHITEVPFMKPTGTVRVGKINGELVALPTLAQMEESELDLIVSGTADAVTMIEGFAREMPEDQMTEAILFAQQQIAKIVGLIDELRTKLGRGPKQLPPAPEPHPLLEVLQERYGGEFREAKLIKGKLDRQDKVKELRDKIVAECLPEDREPVYPADEVHKVIHDLEEKLFRQIVLDGQRLDGRQPDELRALHSEAAVLPRIVHGSALFTRGETQALVTATLGTVGDEQKIEGLIEDVSKKFMLDYNFPSFSVGEARAPRGPGRREIGHGMLAERSLKSVIPPPNRFPYTIRLVAEIMESNGSSSMASVCGGTLALMDAGVPIKQPVAGISIGLVKEPERFVLLTDIQGDEDHFGDMDFKVAGTQNGITGIQLDLKIDGIDEKIIRDTLEQARNARREILKSMLMSLRKPRPEISQFAPRLLQVKINPDKIGLLIGPGGKTIKGIQEATGAKIDIDDDGTVSIAHGNAEGAEAARMRVAALTEEVRIGKVYEGNVTAIKEFGAFVEILPGRDGLVHISELDHRFVGKVDDVCKVGDRMMVKVIAIDEQDRVKLSRKVLMEAPEGSEEDQAAVDGANRGGQQPRGDSGRRGNGRRPG